MRGRSKNLKALAALTFYAVASFGVAVSQDQGAASFARIKPSLAIVRSYGTGNDVSTGSGFCIASDANRSYFLTNGHVIISDKVKLQLQFDGKTYVARVVRQGVSPMDVALVEVDRGNVPAVVLASNLPDAGTPIGVAGYPALHLTSDQEPSVHFGSVSSIMENGALIEHDALTDHGNSGGPLFDRRTGVIYGIDSALIPSQTGSNIVNFIAFAIPYLVPFLDNTKVAYTIVSPGGDLGPGSNVLLAEAPAAFRVGYLAPDASQLGSVPVKRSVDSHIIQRLTSLLNSQVVPIAAADADPNSPGLLCTTNHVNALVAADYDWSAQFEGSVDNVSADTKLRLLDCYSQVIFSGDARQTSAFRGAAIDEVADDAAAVDAAADQALKQMGAAATVDPSAVVNLVRYGYPIGTGKRTAGLTLEPGTSGAVVASSAAFGTAARAGVRPSDVISRLDGQSLAGLSQDRLDALVSHIEGAGGSYDAEILRADGKTVSARFQSEDIAWYLHHGTAQTGGQVAANPPPPMVHTVGGSYAGPVQDFMAGNGEFQLTLSRSGERLSGSWGATFEDPSFDSSGTLWGTTTGATITVTLKTYTSRSCVIALSGTLGSEAISGTYRTQGCTTARSGTFQARHQAVSMPDIAGVYSGSLTDNLAGPGSITVTLTQNGTTLSGTWAANFKDRRFADSGTVSGVLVNATTVQFYLTPSKMTGCPYSATAVLQGAVMKGTYATQDCAMSNGGSFTTTR